jgi:hypothetical protein
MVFLRTFLAVPEPQPLGPLLRASAYVAILSFATAIFLGLVFQYGSAKWVKFAWGQPIKLGPRNMERALDYSFWSMVVAFFVGLGGFIWFARGGQPPNRHLERADGWSAHFTADDVGWHPPVPWNSQEISASFESIEATGADKRIAFRYTLRNNTDFDYRIESMKGISLMGKLEEPASLQGNLGEFFFTLPFFLPARERARLEIKSPPGFKGESKPGADQKATHEEIGAFVNKAMGNLNGFVLFDEARHYKIDFPKGWSKP